MTYHKKYFRLCIGFEKQGKLTCTEELRHNDFNKFKFQPKVTSIHTILENLDKITTQNAQFIT